MRLLYVEHSLAVHGGIERVVTDKVNWLVEYGGCDVCLLTVNQGNHPLVFPLNSKVNYYDLNIMFHHIFSDRLWKRYFRLFQLRRLFRKRLSERIKEFSPDIIICTRLDNISDVMMVKGRIPVVYEAHNFFLACKYDKYSFLQRLQITSWHYALKKVDMIVALTQGDASEWKKHYSKVQVIPNVVHLNDTGRYSDCHNKVALFVGRISYQKDLQSLLRIWKLVNQRYPDWKLHIFGCCDKNNNELSDMCDGIVIHHPSNKVNYEYLNSSMLLLTSRFEPFGLALSEAMSCGLPVVAFDCPYGPADIITDGIDGFIIRDRSIEEFVDKVCLLIENEDLRCKMGRAGVLSSQRYTDKIIMSQWLQLFCEVSNRNCEEYGNVK